MTAVRRLPRGMFDRGDGPPLVVIPGIQGRWEWMRAPLNVLSRDYRVMSYSLAGGLGAAPAPGDGEPSFDRFVRQLDAVLDQAGVPSAALCGISYGGVIAARYAAARPTRVSHLILVSTPGPRWTPTARQAGYVAAPWRSVAAFAATAFGRLGDELTAAFDTWPSRMAFAAKYLSAIVAAPVLPNKMAERVRLQQALPPLIEGIAAPTLVITGEPRLDHVVPVASTREYLDLIPGAQYAMMERTGHLGLLTRPHRFAAIVKEFLASHS